MIISVYFSKISNFKLKLFDIIQSKKKKILILFNSKLLCKFKCIITNGYDTNLLETIIVINVFLKKY